MCWFYHLDAFASLFAGRRLVGGGGGSQANSSLSVKDTPDVSVREKKKEKAKQPDPVTAYRPGERDRLAALIAAPRLRGLTSHLSF